MEIIDGKRLCIYISEKDHYQHQPFYEWIVSVAEKMQMAGVTVMRGIEGFGARHHLHSVKLLRFSIELPIVIELVDRAEMIEKFLEAIAKAKISFLSTLETVEIRHYHAKNNAPEEK